MATYTGVQFFRGHSVQRVTQGMINRYRAGGRYIISEVFRYGTSCVFKSPSY